jgi:hypothetical protein
LAYGSVESEQVVTRRKINVDDPMTILDDLKADHRELKAEIRAILKSDEGKECSALFSHLADGS